MPARRLPVPPETLSRIVDAIQDIRFGSVQIIIHDSRIVQIEKAEKIRVDNSPTCPQEACPQTLPRPTG
jgi:hypothetical protein